MVKNIHVSCIYIYIYIYIHMCVWRTSRRTPREKAAEKREHAGHIVDTLARLSDADVARMQLGVQRAWRRVLSPPTEHRRTLYSLLEKRVGFRFRKRR